MLGRYSVASEVSVLGLEALMATKESANRAHDRALLELLRESLGLGGEGAAD